MRRPLGIALAVFAIASTASAAALSVVPDKTTYYPGETITLAVSGDDAGASSYGIFGRVQFTGFGSVGVGVTSQTQKSVGTGWITGTLSKGASYADAFNEIAGLVAQSADSLPVKNPFSTITLVASALGVVNVNWNTAIGSGFELDFFGLTSAPGTSFTIVECTKSVGCPAVPEPGTGALLALGLVALAVRRPERSW